ncbi:MAG: PAS domain S-box protein [Microcoleus sp.]
MGYFKIEKFQISPYLAAISAAAAILTGVWVLDRSEQQRFWESNRANTLSQVSTVRSKLEGSLNSRLFLMRGLVAYISNNPNITEGEFAATAKIMLAKQNGIRSIALVKGTTVAYIYPREGNERALGIDLTAIPEQRRTLEEAIETRQTILAGPITLLQGGIGFISRSPIFLTPAGKNPETGVYWGLTGVVIDKDTLFDEAGLRDSASNLQYALRGKDAKGASGEVFFGDESIFQQNPVLLDVTLPNGSWQLAAIPRSGWSENSPFRGWLLGGGGLLALLSSVVAFSWVYGPAKLRESEAKYRQLVENANSIIVQLDSQGNITFFNEFAETFFGYSQAEIIGKSPIGTLICEAGLLENDLDKIIHDFLKHLEKYFKNETENIRKNGEKVWIAWRNQPLLDAGGNLTGLLCVGTDLTDRKLAEAAVQESESRYRAIIEDQTELICRFLPNGNLTFVNDAYCRYFNKSRSNLLGNSFLPLICEEDRKKISQIVNSLSLENPAVTWEHRLVFDTGEIRWMQWTNRVIHDDRGTAIECQGVGRDISDRKQAEIALQTSEAELRALFAAMNDVIFVINTEGRYLKIAPTNPELLYKPAAEVIGKTLHEILPRETADLLLDRIRLATNTNRTQSVEYSLNIRNKPIWFAVTISPIPENTALVVARNISDKKHAENWQLGQKQVLEAIAKSASLAETLTALIKIIEQQSPNIMGSILLLDRDGEHLLHGAAPSLPESYNSVIHGVAIGPNVGSCGTAVYRKEAVIVTDIATDPLWADFRDLALSFGLKACWSTPILSSQGEVLGTFAMYYSQPHNPQEFEWQLVETASNLAGIAIENQQREESLKQLNQELEIRVEQRTFLLKQTEERWQLALKGNNDGIWDWNLQTKQLFVSDRFKEITGYADSDINNYVHTWNINLHPDDLAVAGQYLQEHLERKTPHYIHEYRLWCHNSHYKWILSRGQALWDEAGKLVRMVGSITDITEPKQAEESLRQSEARFQKLAANLPGMIYQFLLRVDGSVSFPYMSPACWEILGLNPEAIQQNAALVIDLIHPEDRQNYHESVTVSAKTLQPWHWEGRMVLPSGDLRWFQANSRPEAKDNGEILWDGLIIDITDRKQAEAALQESQHFVQRIADATPGILYLYDLEEQRNVYANSSLGEILGYPLEEVQAMGSGFLPQLVHPEDMEKIARQIAEFDRISDGEISEIEYRMQAANREWIWLQSRNSIFSRNSEGKPKLIVGFAQDINNRKQAESALRDSEMRERERAEQLEKALVELHSAQSQLVQTEKMSSLGQLVAGIAHEINNPVNFIHANISYLKQYTKDLLDLVELYHQEYPEPKSAIVDRIAEIELDFMTEDLIKIVGSMQVGTDRIRQIVLSLRNFSRLDEAEMKPVDIHAGIESTLLILQHRLKSRDKRPEIAVIKNLGKLPLVECYASQINQVFMNVIANGIDAIEERYQKLSDRELESNSGQIVICTSVKDKNTIEIEIADNGCGISEETIDRIFNPFFTTKVVGKGTGLGMSISHSIVVEKHKGKLDCTSEVGKGTSFKIQIPIAKIDNG